MNHLGDAEIGQLAVFKISANVGPVIVSVLGIAGEGEQNRKSKIREYLIV